MTFEDLPEEAIEPAELVDLRDAQRAFDDEQRSGITSTDVAAILQLSRYGTPLTIYRSKRGELAPRPPTLQAWIGLRLENMVSELYAAATSTRVRADNQFHRHRQHEWFGCHLDRRAVGDPRLVVELKTRNSMRGWGEDGSAEVPPDVWCQVQAQMEIVEARECHVATLFGNSAFRVYRILPDPRFIAELIPTLDRFYHENVLAGVPPAPTGADRDTQILSLTPGGNSGFVKPATPEQELAVAKLRLARMNDAQAKLARAEAENLVKDIIGEADGLSGSFGTIWWKRTKDWVKYDWKLLAAVYRNAALELLELVEPTEAAEVVRSVVEVAPSLYGEPRQGSRRLDLRDLREE